MKQKKEEYGLAGKRDPWGASFRQGRFFMRGEKRQAGPKAGKVGSLLQIMPKYAMKNLNNTKKDERRTGKREKIRKNNNREKGEKWKEYTILLDNKKEMD